MPRGIGRHHFTPSRPMRRHITLWVATTRRSLDARFTFFFCLCRQGYDDAVELLACERLLKSLLRSLMRAIALDPDFKLTLDAER